MLNNLRRRPPRFYVIVTLVLVGVYLFAAQTHTAIQEIKAERGEPGVGASSPGVRSSAKSGGAVHPIDEFVRGFPQLRGKGELGVPDLSRRDGEEGKTVFDWARTKKMFVLYVSCRAGFSKFAVRPSS